MSDLMRTLDVGKRVAAIAEFAEGAVKKSLHDVIAKMLGNQMLTLRENWKYTWDDRRGRGIVVDVHRYMGCQSYRIIYVCKGHKKSLLTGENQKHAFCSAGVKERDKKKLSEGSR